MTTVLGAALGIALVAVLVLAWYTPTDTSLTEAAIHRAGVLCGTDEESTRSYARHVGR